MNYYIGDLVTAKSVFNDRYKTCGFKNRHFSILPNLMDKLPDRNNYIQLITGILNEHILIGLTADVYGYLYIKKDYIL